MPAMTDQQIPSGKLLALGELMSKVAVDRDKTAFAGLFDHYAPLIRAYSLAREPGSDLVADELVQEVMTRVWLKAAKYNPRLANLNTWIFTLARNCPSTTCGATAATSPKSTRPTSSTTWKTKARVRFSWCNKAGLKRASEQVWKSCRANNLKYWPRSIWRVKATNKPAMN